MILLNHFINFKRQLRIIGPNDYKIILYRWSKNTSCSIINEPGEIPYFESLYVPSRATFDLPLSKCFTIRFKDNLGKINSLSIDNKWFIFNDCNYNSFNKRHFRQLIRDMNIQNKVQNKLQLRVCIFSIFLGIIMAIIGPIMLHYYT